VREGSNTPLTWNCRDRGGANLVACEISGADASTGMLDTSTPGKHTVTVTATDGAGNVTTKQASYVVAAAHAVDAAVRVGKGAWKGAGTVAGAKKQQVAAKLTGKQKKRTAKVRITNRGASADRFVVTGKGSTRLVKIVHRVAGREVKVTGTGFRTPTLAPGQSVRVTVKLKRMRAVKRTQLFPLRVRSTADASVRDAVRVKVKVRK
jgi:hypothetical protein